MEEKHSKLWSIIDRCETATLISNSDSGYPHGRTMECIQAKQVEEIWFTTSQSERKIKEIKANKQVTVFYTHPQKGWACVYGEAEVVTDQEVKNCFWKDDWDKHFPDGPTSEEYVLIRIVPIGADYLLHEGYERGHVDFSKTLVT